MKILFISEWVENYGGGEAVLISAKHSLKEDVVIFSLWNDSPEIDVSKESVLRFVSSAKKSLLAVISFAIHQFWVGKFDVVVTFSHLFAHTARVRGSRAAIRINYIHTPARYLWYPDIDNRGPSSNSLFWRSLKNFVRFLDWKMHDVKGINVANSNYVAKRIKECWGVDSVVCYPPVDTSFFSSFISVEKAQGTIVTAGRLVSYKCFDRVIRVAATLNWKLILIGQGPELKTLLHLARSLNVELIHIGFCDRATLARTIASASVFVFGGVEDFGILPVEAMACGTPVVGLNKGGLTETVTPQSGILVQHEDEMAEACIRASQLLPISVSQSTEKFSQQRFMKEFASIIKKSIDRHS